MPKTIGTKRRAELLTLLKVKEFPEPLLQAIDALLRTGLRTVNPDNEDAPIECCAEYHFARMSGVGATLAPLLYFISFRLAKESGNFHLSLQKLQRFLNVQKDDYMYAAAYLLAASGFWEVIEAPLGEPVRYRPIGHEEWARKHPGFCTSRLKLAYSDGDELGRALYGILGEEYFDNVLKGLRNTGASDEQIKEAAKQFMAEDKNRGVGRERRKRFQEYLESKMNSKPTGEVPALQG